MFVVIFEVEPRPERWNDYLDLARQLRPKLEAIDGFIDNERYQSGRREGRVLSLSTWRDEKALIRWRTQAEHHAVQQKGRVEIFADYHLRVGEVTADSKPPPGLRVIEQRFDETAFGAAKAATISEWLLEGARPGADVERQKGLIDHELFDSISTGGKVLLLAGWRDAAAAEGWRPQPPAEARSWRHRQVRIIRDYGMRERAEAPQFHPAS